MTAQEIIDRDFNTKWSVEDFVYGYCQANDIELTDENEAEITEIVEEMIESGELGLRGFRDVVITDINERMIYIF